MSGYRQIWHIQDEPEALQGEIWKHVERAAMGGIQLTPLDFCELDGTPTLDGMPADQWLDAMLEA